MDVSMIPALVKEWEMNIKLLTFVVTALAVFFLVTYAIFFYWNIDDNNKWSTFFSFTSTFGILATIFVYYMQKESDDKKQKARDDIIKRNIKSIIKEKKDTINDINEFINSSFQEEIISFKVEYSVKLPIALISLIENNELFQYKIIRISNNELLKEAISNRYKVSDEIAQSVEELKKIIYHLDRHVSMAIIDKLSREEIHNRNKIKILIDFRDRISLDYLSKLDEIMKRITPLH
ncbi:Uncharacterised protein [Proteus vulgaris]|uniref:Phage protein n=1 Tax=Proteus vulgaris TaxID=585 RepID=A0A379F4D5_PROVU|nr:hypothetical protein [Proteus vulgaris]SUC14457.1 Uncharacterised protein [Proteus vulgaris]